MIPSLARLSSNPSWSTEDLDSCSSFPRLQVFSCHSPSLRSSCVEYARVLSSSMARSCFSFSSCRIICVNDVELASGDLGYPCQFSGFTTPTIEETSDTHLITRCCAMLCAFRLVPLWGHRFERRTNLLYYFFVAAHRAVTESFVQEIFLTLQHRPRVSILERWV